MLYMSVSHQHRIWFGSRGNSDVQVTFEECPAIGGGGGILLAGHGMLHVISMLIFLATFVFI